MSANAIAAIVTISFLLLCGAVVAANAIKAEKRKRNKNKYNEKTLE